MGRALVRRLRGSARVRPSLADPPQLATQGVQFLGQLQHRAILGGDVPL